LKREHWEIRLAQFAPPWSPFMAGMGILAGGAEVFFGTKFRRGKNGKSNFAPAGPKPAQSLFFLRKC
jgi:hypothetical protein